MLAHAESFIVVRALTDIRIGSVNMRDLFTLNCSDCGIVLKQFINVAWIYIHISSERNPEFGLKV